MHSSISNSERPFVDMPWPRIFMVVLIFFILFSIGMEWRLAQIGIAPTVSDSQEKWEAERIRASQLGKNALILIGASRIQLGVDLAILKKETGLEPVQLAIDGSSSTPILAGLANDPKIQGTIIVDYYDHNIGDNGGLAEKYQHGFENHGSGVFQLSPYNKSEKFLTEWLHERARIYAEGASPLNSFLFRILNDDGARELLVTHADRSRQADYTQVKMPDYYYSRVARNLGIEMPSVNANSEPILKKYVSLQKVQNNKEFIRNVLLLKQLVAKVEAHGGRVLFLVMPSSGMVREIEERRYPVGKFWKPFIEMIGVRSIRSADHELLQNFTCPDGSHLDMRDRARFTLAMTYALGINRLALEN
ncbi:MAG: hypothetical protein ACXU8A_03590 [Burkholderiaceae bacterium]